MGVIYGHWETDFYLRGSQSWRSGVDGVKVFLIDDGTEENLCMVIRVCEENDTSCQKLKEFIGLAAPINSYVHPPPFYLAEKEERQTWLSPVYMSMVYTQP